MKKVALIILFLVIASWWFFSNYSTQVDQITDKTSEVSTFPTTSPGKQIFDRVVAQFEIYTNGTKRVFTDAMYHYQSEDVYIDSSNTNMVVVSQNVEKRPTWGDFFDTLPMSLTKNCLITGTGQEFCNSETYELKFILDGVNEPDALDRLINQDSFLRVEYSRR